jgi:hypothetical protein
MQDIFYLLKSQPLFKSFKGASNDDIKKAEETLNVFFSKEYTQYLAEFGFVIYEGHELTGICKTKRLNVVDVTLREREMSPEIPETWYVIEELNIDGIVIWQSSTGEIYQTSPNREPVKICDTLAEYIIK